MFVLVFIFIFTITSPFLTKFTLMFTLVLLHIFMYTFINYIYLLYYQILSVSKDMQYTIFMYTFIFVINIYIYIYTYTYIYVHIYKLYLFIIISDTERLLGMLRTSWGQSKILDLTFQDYIATQNHPQVKKIILLIWTFVFWLF